MSEHTWKTRPTASVKRWLWNPGPSLETSQESYIIPAWQQCSACGMRRAAAEAWGIPCRATEGATRGEEEGSDGPSRDRTVPGVSPRP